MADKKQEKKKAGAQSSSSSHKAGIARTLGRLSEKKLRHVLKRNGATAAWDHSQKSSSLTCLRKIAGERTFAGSVAREALND